VLTAVAAFAPAKVNLYLHVVGRRADGLHLLDSLVAFADIGDCVRAAQSAVLSLAVSGPEAGPITGLGEDNLVLRAARLLAGHGAIAAGAALQLDKQLPVAAGLGGGSSDAAAALRALASLWRVPIPEQELLALAAGLGADVPACLNAGPVWVGGIGERLVPAPALPPVGIVLANPRKPLPTAAVFGARRGPFSDTGRFEPMPREAAALAQMLTRRRNDLTEPAMTLVPEIRTVLGRLAALPGALLSRMSGSGASCFALFEDRAAAIRAWRLLAAAEPGWWCAAGTLGAAPQQFSRQFSG